MGRSRAGLFESRPALPKVGVLRSGQVQKNPGREAGFDPPDKPLESEWRSLYYVTYRHSADGNTYRPGDPIPKAEAIRQGIIPDDGIVVDAPGELRHRYPCPRCKGTGDYSTPKPKGHRKTCECSFCGPCTRCKGRGFIEVVNGKEVTEEAEEAADKG